MEANNENDTDDGRTVGVAGGTHFFSAKPSRRLTDDENKKDDDDGRRRDVSTCGRERADTRKGSWRSAAGREQQRTMVDGRRVNLKKRRP